MLWTKDMNTSPTLNKQVDAILFLYLKPYGMDVLSLYLTP